MRMGLLPCSRVFWVDSGVSVGYLGNNKALKACGVVFAGLDHSGPRNGRNGIVRHGNAQCGLEKQGSASADLRQKAFCWFVVAEECTVSHDGGISSSFR